MHGQGQVRPAILLTVRECAVAVDLCAFLVRVVVRAAFCVGADHSEYPSASACLCEALAAAMKLYFDTPKLNFTRPVPAGSSRNEPGVPAQTIFLSYTSWDGFVKACGQSRIDGGLHFPAAVEVVCAHSCDAYKPYLLLQYAQFQSEQYCCCGQICKAHGCGL